MLDPSSPEGSSIALTDAVENYTGFSDIAGFDLIQHFYSHAKSFGANFVRQSLVGIRKNYDGFILECSDSEVKTKSVILCMGATHKKLGIDGENKFEGRGVSYCAVCDGAFYAGRDVAVVGGGNVAMDAARCSKRLGAEVYVVYRRGMEELPARHEEVEHAIEEGVIFKTLNNPVQINGDEQDCVKSMTCIEMELGEPDASGRRRPVEKKGSEFDLSVDAVIMSLGTSPNPLIKSTTKGLEVNKKGGIIVNEEGLTSRQAVYAGGDAVTGAATVILAMGAGKLGAKSIDEYLSK